jgi:hypothetical protein
LDAFIISAFVKKMMDFLHGAKRLNVAGHKLIANLCRAEVRGGFSTLVVNGCDFRLFALVLRQPRERVQFRAPIEGGSP